VLFEAGTGEELLTEVIDLDRVRQIRENGTRALNPLLKELREASPAFVERSTRRLLAGSARSSEMTPGHDRGPHPA
jgi:hypothetical protein